MKTAARLAIGFMLAYLSNSALAVSPEKIRLGNQLFVKNWSPKNPSLGGDGLGPLFNGTSCVACHHQGGIGGGGDARFNANSLGIEHMKIAGGHVTDDVIKSAVSSIHPNFVSQSGQVQNTLVLHHHGGTANLQRASGEIKSKLDTIFDTKGGSSESSEVRRAYSTPFLFNTNVGDYSVTASLRLYQRNTTPLFGLGLIDQIDGKTIEEQVRLQKSHPEISGRPSTLRNGLYGKFGWRGNRHTLAAFVDQALAAELGLETDRISQPFDATAANYRNTSIDVQDGQVLAISDFLAALPAPTREIPSDSKLRESAARGEALFTKIGCAVCHVPNMGPAKGVYSDILLHDMGYASMDLNGAMPYIVRATSINRSSVVASETRVTGTGRMTTGYYGQSSEMSIDTTQSSFRSGGTSKKSHPRYSGPEYEFKPATGPSVRIEVMEGNSERQIVQSSRAVNQALSFTGNLNLLQTDIVQHQQLIRLHYEDTKINQEWRTPPLWGVADSAPYMHDGRAETIFESISMHDGEASGTRDRFLTLPLADRHAILDFLNTLVAPKGLPQFDPDRL